MDEIAFHWRRKLLETLEPHEGAPLLLSGGMDSATLLVAATKIGWKPHCYSFMVAGQVSDDVRMARRIVQDYNCEWTLLTLKADLDSLLHDVAEVVDLIGTNRKTAVQCSHPVLKMAQAIHRDHGHLPAADRKAIVGTGAIVLDDKHLAILAARSEDEAREYRRAKLDDKNDVTCGTGCMHMISRKAGVLLVEPYSEEPLVSFALALDVAEINRYRQKWLAVRAFPELRPYWRRNSPLQVNSGVREWHEILRTDPLSPYYGASSIQSVYGAILKRVRHETLA